MIITSIILTISLLIAWVAGESHRADKKKRLHSRSVVLQRVADTTHRPVFFDGRTYHPNR